MQRKRSRKDFDRERRLRPAEEAAKELKITTAVDPWINVDSPSPKLPTQPPPKEERKGPPLSKETKASGDGIMDKPMSRYPPTVGSAFLHILVRWSKIDLLIDNDPPASGSRVTAEERRQHRAPPQEAKEKDRKDLGVSLNLLLE